MSGKALVAAIAAPLLAFALAGAPLGGNAGAVIVQVEFDSQVGELVIHGRNFCRQPTVTLGTATLANVSGTDAQIIAWVEDIPTRGGYRLTVDCARGTNGFATFDLAVTCRGGGGGGGGGGDCGGGGGSGGGSCDDGCDDGHG